MQIGPVLPLPPISAVNQVVNAAHQRALETARVKAAAQEGPPVHPTVQDLVQIDQTLIGLRQL